MQEEQEDLGGKQYIILAIYRCIVWAVATGL